MPELKQQKRCVAGRVKSRPNRDGSVTFTVAGKEGKRFTLSGGSEHAKKLAQARRALVGYEDGGRNPKILYILTNPSNLLIRQHMVD